MSVSIVPSLQTKRDNYVNKIENARDQITRCERGYESLSGFKTIVLQSQVDFYALNTNKSSFLSAVTNVKKTVLQHRDIILE